MEPPGVLAFAVIGDPSPAAIPESSFLFRIHPWLSPKVYWSLALFIGPNTCSVAAKGRICTSPTYPCLKLGRKLAPLGYLTENK